LADNRVLYQDRTAALTEETIVLRGFTKVLGRARRISLSQIASFRVRSLADFPNEQLPRWGVDDRGVWYTRDPRRWRRQTAIELTFVNGEEVGFTPAHGHRFQDLLHQLGVKEA
jgi:hypothetical protein